MTEPAIVATLDAIRALAPGNESGRFVLVLTAGQLDELEEQFRADGYDAAREDGYGDAGGGR